jgi:hypothetical protein
MRMSEAEEIERLRREVADLRRELEARDGTIAGLRFQVDQLTARLGINRTARC